MVVGPRVPEHVQRGGIGLLHLSAVVCQRGTPHVTVMVALGCCRDWCVCAPVYMRSALSVDSRNFHAWNYRQFVAKLLGVPSEAELAYTTTCIAGALEGPGLGAEAGGWGRGRSSRASAQRLAVASECPLWGRHPG